MSEVIDLDSLLPESVTVRLGKEDIVIEPPSMESVMRLGAITQRMGKIDANDLSAASDDIKALTEQVYICAPALKGKTLNSAQLLKLVTIITEMAIPADAKELEERGITGDTPKATP